SIEPSGASVFALALVPGNNGTGDLYVAGVFTSVNNQTRTNLARLGASGTGQLDPTWAPNPQVQLPGVGITAISVSGSNVFVAGNFSAIGGQPVAGVARLSATGAGAADPQFAPNPSVFPGNLAALLAVGNDLYLGGDFQQSGGEVRNG